MGYIVKNGSASVICGVATAGPSFWSVFLQYKSSLIYMLLTCRGLTY